MANSPKGFTLIEILVVMSMIAVMASLFALSVQGRDDDDVVDEIITTFVREANYAQEEILFRRFPIGIARPWPNSWRSSGSTSRQSEEEDFRLQAQGDQ